MPSVPDRQAEFPDVPNWHNIRTGELSAWKRFADGHGIYYPQGATRSRIATNVRSWLERREAGASLPSVPNWIAKAVVFTPGTPAFPLLGNAQPVKSWRATRTQVVVTVAAERGLIEMRFRLDNLKRVGGDPGIYHFDKAYLAPSSAPEVVAFRRIEAIRDARVDVLDAVERERIQDATDVKSTLRSLMRIRAAVEKAMADLGEVL